MSDFFPALRSRAGRTGIAAALAVALTAMASGEPRAVRDFQPSSDTWWSLQPLHAPRVPVVGSPCANPVDAFIRARLAAEGVGPSPEADRATLARRLSVDLLGLPPDSSEVAAFVSDPDPMAYERLVDRWLASPRYGERWARHWLDVVHYGETHGYDKDQPRPNAWPYRDYVIRAFNEDRPYSRFIEEQVAGDVLHPGTRDGFEALGFIAAGPWDLIGHAEVPESKMDGQVARHLDRDDMVVNTLQTFNSLTVQCAQCHDHKFDPIPQEDYYRLQAVFAALDRAEQPYDTDPVVARERRRLHQREAELLARRQAMEREIRARAGAPLAEIEHLIEARERHVREGQAYGYHSAIESAPDTVKWVQVELEEAHALHEIVLHPCRDDFNGIGEGFGFPVRYRVEVSPGPGFEDPVTLADFGDADVPNPRLTPTRIAAAGRSVRVIRVTAVKLATRQEDYIFALAELGAWTGDGRNVAAGANVTALDSIEAPVRWQRQNLTDGWYPGLKATDDGELAALKVKRDARIAMATLETEQVELDGLREALEGVAAALRELPTPARAYVAAVYTGNGAFSGTGANGGKPRAVRILNRGSIERPGREVEPGALQCLPALSPSFGLPANHGEGDRRAALARWLAAPENVLTWRSIVNRVWQYHFGRGIVDTPNDFGRMGSLPSHPELLDWLAATFRDGPQGLKALHRLLVTSATYRQVSTDRPDAAARDSDNRLLWRMNRRKLEAEALRDAILSVSGRLDLRMGGPGFRDFVVEKPEHSPHYEYGLHDPDDPASHRRTVYRWIVRSQPQPFLTTLDCADPSMQVARRNESASPLQALAVMNNALVLTMAGHFADILVRSAPDPESQVRHAWWVAFGRAPDAETVAVLAAHARSHGLANSCRLLFNLNEFAFVD
ncbi:MAG: DUF1553 domain-containing protein [Verrucomicrobiae bacterium]|nr:DUF1553 domain-containing protein [Verrucomicrobiae bacterium]